MSARSKAVVAVHWTVTTLAAAITSLAAAIPFHGPYASAAGVIAAAGVCLTGLATAPPRKDTRS